ncbi:hypothetical protein [Nitrosomonas halophila]|nr:hypothetical protein [Nitrosomonas halophila]
MAHEGTPNMAFAWRQGKILIDTQRQGRQLGDHIVFTIPFAGSLTPYRMSDASFRGIGFDQGGTLHYQFVSTLMKWSPDQNRWMRDGFDEQLSIRMAFVTRKISAWEGEDSQGLVGFLSASGSTDDIHPTFELQKTDGSAPDDGAYLVALTLFGTSVAGDQILYPPSKPFFLAFHMNTGGGFNPNAFSQSLAQFSGIPLSDYSRIDPLFDWAEANFSEIFPHPAQSRFLFGFYARCYDNAICLGSKRGRVFTTGGPFGGLTDHGPLKSFFDQAGIAD